MIRLRIFPDVRNVLKKEDHILSGNSLRVSPYYPEVGVLPKDSRAIKFDPSGFVKPPLSSLEIDFESMDQERDTVEVTGIQGLHEDEMRLLFENRKKSGGGTIKDFKIIDKKCMALVTFENEGDYITHNLYYLVDNTCCELSMYGI